MVIAWRDRPELAETLAHNARHLAAHDAEIVVVNCGGQPTAALTEALARLALPRLRWLDVPVPRFNKSLALNLGAWAARAGRLFFLDADVLLEPDVLPAALGHLDAGPCLVTVERVRESQAAPAPSYPALAEIAYTIELVTPDGRTAQVETNRVRPGDGSRSGPGLVLLPRDQFLAVDGMNAALEGWGWEDLDLLARLQLALGLPRRRAGTVVHLSHGDDRRALLGRSRGATENDNFQRCLANLGAGNYHGTFARDVAAWASQVRVRELRPACGSSPAAPVV